MRTSKQTKKWMATLVVTGLGVAVLAPAAQAADEPEPASVQTALTINEVQSSDPADGPDWIELTNTSDQPIDPNGVVVLDNSDSDPYTIVGKDPLAPGAYLLLSKDTDFSFGLGKGDSVRLFSTGTTDFSGATPFDATTWPADNHTVPSWGRCPDGIGDFAMTTAATPGAVNDCSEPEPEVGSVDDIVINEIESNGDNPDWIELKNTGALPVDVAGLQLVDNGGDEQYAIPADTTIVAGGYLIIDGTQFTFGLGSDDSAILLSADGNTVLDQYDWTEHAATTYGRCPDGTGNFADTATATPGATNDCAEAPLTDFPIVINEVESNGDDTDWVEVMNVGAEAFDISGYVFKDDKDDHSYALPEGSVVAAAGVFVIDQLTTASAGFDFGLGNPDTVRLFDPSGTTLLLSETFSSHAAVTWARCPNGTGNFVDSTSSTKGELNDCSTPVRINEIESSGDAADWVELINISDAPVDITGLILSDNKDEDVFTIPSTPALAAGGIVVFERTDDPATGFDYGLGGGDDSRYPR